ncbi:hypothetical protein DFQ27_007501 [Actinomortierella ambigua]|uniref:Glutathione S-transferase n=1 Tax=Actinomortierella ambigua TaxID=1343610 RepID=A0A9P6PV01_9FUNG|nr:hypothetical protein DFQ27_007501 [Actinomortierella ambigua]
MSNNKAPTTTTEYDLTPKSESKFVVFYFDMHGNCMTIRSLLCLANAIWEDKLTSFGPAWDAEKPKTPFGALPILYETRPDGDTRMLPEASAIERYLSRTLGFMGADDWEEAQINVYVSLIEETGRKWLFKCFEVPEAEARAKSVTEWIDGDLAKLVSHAEKQIQQNGHRGYLVGNKISYADVLLSTWLDVWMSMDSSRVVNKTATPGIWRLKQAIDHHPHMAAYRNTELFEEFNRGQQGFFGSMMDYDYKRSQVL